MSEGPLERDSLGSFEGGDDQPTQPIARELRCHSRVLSHDKPDVLTDHLPTDMVRSFGLPLSKKLLLRELDDFKTTLGLNGSVPFSADTSLLDLQCRWHC